MRTLIPVMREMLRKCRGYFIGLWIAGIFALMTGCKSEENYNLDYSINSSLVRREADFWREKEGGVGNKPREKEGFFVDDKEAGKILKEIEEARDSKFRRKASRIEELTSILEESNRELGFVSHAVVEINNARENKSGYREDRFLLNSQLGLDSSYRDYGFGRFKIKAKKEKRGFLEKRYSGDSNFIIYALNRAVEIPKEIGREIERQTTFELWGEEFSFLLEPKLDTGIGIIEKIGVRIRGSPEKRVYITDDGRIMFEIEVKF